MYSYIFKGVTHTDYGMEYMAALGMNDEQRESVLNQREFEGEQFALRIRHERDRKLMQARAWLERHRDEAALSLPHTLACTEQDLLLHIQALRDVPQQLGFPDSVEWPEVPQ